MSNGYILLHRQGLTTDEWKHPLRTLAWIDFCTLAAYKDYTAHDGVLVRRGEVIASYGFLSKRWGRSKGRVHEWIQFWMAERQVERQPERCAERNAERFFIVNYAKYQDSTERLAERVTEREPERLPEPIKGKVQNQNVKITPVGLDGEIIAYLATLDSIGSPAAYMRTIRQKAGDAAIRKAWREWKRGTGIQSPGDFFQRCVFWQKALAAPVAPGEHVA